MRQFAILLAICFFLYGCASSSTPVNSQSPSSLAAQLERRNITVVVLGDQILIVLPSAEIFRPYTSNIMPTAYSSLNTVVKYINSYASMLVNVSVYTANTGSKEIDLQLSKDQAKNIEKYLLEAGLDARVLHATGYGGKHLVSKNTLDWQFNMNYRTEITLEKLKVL